MMVRLSLAILLILSNLGLTQAHEFYDQWCCNHKDCAPIPAERVTAGPDGWHIVLLPGDHPMVTKRNEYFVRYGKPQFYESQHRTSPDGRFHACLFPNEEVLRCFYSPPMGF